jgi:DNA-binding transcriptional MerR regulator
MLGRVTDGAYSVGAVAGRLGVAPETLRSWGRRYGLLPSLHTAGGHRRYTTTDLARLVTMQRLIGQGVSPARAAHSVLEMDPEQSMAPLAEEETPQEVRRPGGPGGRVLAVPGGSAEARGLARAASRLDAQAINDILSDDLATRGALTVWDDVIRPVLVATGARWARTGTGIDIEHVLSEATLEALRAHRACQLRPHPGRPVLLACSPEDMHVLPLHIVAAVLAERQVPTQLLGARVPHAALLSALRRTNASAAFVWRQRTSDAEAVHLPTTRPPLVLVVGGPGWQGTPLPSCSRVAQSLRDAVELLQATPR